MIRFYAKDFITTREGLIFAVVSNGVEDGKVLCFLRYIKTGQRWNKADTDHANQFLAQNYPHYLYFSQQLDAHLHAVSIDSIYRHHQPRHRLSEIMNSSRHAMGAEYDCFQLCNQLQQHNVPLEQVGVTGSVLVSLQNDLSDIDLVIYDRKVFFQCQQAFKSMLHVGLLYPLRESDWVFSYQRRDCELSLTEYVWHETRKLNKVVFNGRKVDISLAQLNENSATTHFSKQGEAVVQATVMGDYYSYDSPSVYDIDHPDISSIISFTPTYTGQAVRGELIEAAGKLEQSSDGHVRLVVGSSREARGEYIKVIQHARYTSD